MVIELEHPIFAFEHRTSNIVRPITIEECKCKTFTTNLSACVKKDIFKVLWSYVKNYEGSIHGKKSDILELLNNTGYASNRSFIWKIMQT